MDRTQLLAIVSLVFTTGASMVAYALGAFVQSRHYRQTIREKNRIIMSLLSRTQPTHVQEARNGK